MSTNPYSVGTIPPQPFQIDPEVKPKLDPEYVEFFEKHLTHNSAILYTNLTPLDELRAGGNVVPGQTPILETGKKYDTKVPRKYTNLQDPEVPVRVFVPHGEAPAEGWPVMIYFHGGGWVLGSIDTENSYISRLTEWGKCVVISVDYRMAPENIYPACIEDAYEATMYVYEHPEEFGVNIKKVGFGGCSAGGNITAVICHKLADPSSEFAKKGFPMPVLQLLIVPVTDNSASAETHASYKEFENTPQLPTNKMMWYRHHYLPDPKTWTEPEASPVYYSAESFKKQPTAYFIVGGADVLRTEAEVYGKKLEDAGVEVKMNIYPGMVHTVLMMDKETTQGAKAVKDSTDYVKKVFYENS